MSSHPETPPEKFGNPPPSPDIGTGERHMGLVSSRPLATGEARKYWIMQQGNVKPAPGSGR